MVSSTTREEEVLGFRKYDHAVRVDPVTHDRQEGFIVELQPDEFIPAVKFVPQDKMTADGIRDFGELYSASAVTAGAISRPVAGCTCQSCTRG